MRERVTALAEALKINYALTELQLSFDIPDLITAALQANRDPTTQHAKKLAFDLRLQQEGLVPPAKPARFLA